MLVCTLKFPMTDRSNSDALAPVCSPPSDLSNSNQYTTWPSTIGLASDDPGCDDLPMWRGNETPVVSMDLTVNLPQRWTPLHLAIGNGNETMARFLPSVERMLCCKAAMACSLTFRRRVRQGEHLEKDNTPKHALCSSKNNEKNNWLLRGVRR